MTTADNYRNHTLLVSDTPDNVRACDVQRLLDEIPAGFDRADFLGWLREEAKLPRTLEVIETLIERERLNADELPPMIRNRLQEP